MQEKRRRRHGDRKEGRLLRTLDPYNTATPFIMKDRTDALVYFSDSIEITDAEKYLRQKRAEGMKGVGMLHLFTAAYVRTVSQRPALNRFISGQRIYARNNIEYVMSVKKEMTSAGSETSIKVVFNPKDTMADVYRKMDEQIQQVKEGEADTSTDRVAAILMKMPRLLLRFAIGCIKFADYFGCLPASLLNASPFHGSIIITDLGSLGIPPVFHHIYNLGNLPIFLAIGMKRYANEIARDGSVQEKKYLDYTVVGDERICDGFYFAQSFRYLKSYMRHPEQLDVPPEQVFEDVD